jgi:hypothetical protein
MAGTTAGSISGLLGLAGGLRADPQGGGAGPRQSVPAG